MTVTIITVVYNNALHIEQGIQSVFNQDYPNVEYIVVDGGSVDGTIDIIQRYSGKISRFCSEPDKGIYDALNKGLAMATGQVVGILHSDDVFDSPTVISDIVRVFKEKNCDAVYSDLWYVSRDNPGKVIRNWKSKPFDVHNFYHGWMPAHPTLFLKREVYQNFGGFDLSFPIAADYDFMLRTLGSGKLSCAYLPRVITRMKTGGASNKSLGNIWQKSMDDLRALRKNKIGGWYSLIMKNVSKLNQFLVSTPKK